MKKVTLNNGFRLLYEQSKTGSETASIQIFCDFGSIHEKDQFRGAAHFIEHMCFKVHCGQRRLITNLLPSQPHILGAVVNYQSSSFCSVNPKNLSHVSSIFSVIFSQKTSQLSVMFLTNNLFSLLLSCKFLKKSLT